MHLQKMHIYMGDMFLPRLGHHQALVKNTDLKN